MKARSKSSKGLNAGAAVFIMVGVLVVLVGLVPVFQFLESIGTSTAQDSDRQDLESLGANVNNKCQDVTGGTTGASTAAISMDFTMKRAEALSIQENGPTDHTLLLSFPENPDATYDVSGCDLELEDENSGDDELTGGTWTLVIKHKEDTENPPVIRIEGS